LEKDFTVDDCPTTAREICGREYSMDELMAEVEKERAVMEDSGGGVTLCGGEPLMHPEGTLEVLRELGRRGFHRTVDTTLYAKPEVVDAVAAECELLLIDLKLMDSEKHRRYTGVGNELILENLRRVAEAGHDFRIRIPLIDGVNADDENIEQTARFLSTLHLPPSTLTVHLLPYHDVGKDKHSRMGSAYNPERLPMAPPSEALLQHCKSLLEAYGLSVVIGG
jgi:pyruvate formate lyase activating enzyme